jgi:hypothetical protein
MEPITIAGAIATLVLSEAFKEGGKTLGKGASDKITQLITVIREKFRLSGTEVLLTRVEKQPTEPTVAILEAELVTQMSEDKIFAERLAELVKQLESVGVTRQIAITGINAASLEVGDVIQRTKNNNSTEQVIGSNLEIGGDAKFGNLTQEG